MLVNKVPFIVTLTFTDDDEALFGTPLLANRIVTLSFIAKTISIE